VGLRGPERFGRHCHAPQCHGEKPVYEGNGGRAAYFDLATPYYAVEHTFNHMGLSPEMHRQITWDFYQSGNMLYIDSDSHAKLKKDVSDFILSSLPKLDAQ
jgi:hypothetical protein